MRRTALGLAALLAFSLAAGALTAGADEATLTIPPEPAGGDASLRIKKLLPPHVGCAVMVLGKDAAGAPVVFKRGYGVRRLASAPEGADQRVTPTTTFRVASFTKVLTAAAVLKLADQEKLSLDDVAVRWLPGLPPHYHQVTVRQMLDHTSGLPPYHGLIPEQPNTDASDLTVLRAVARAPGLLQPPGQFPPPGQFVKPGIGVAYSNTAYVLLGLVVQQASGRPFADYVRDEILLPAGMAGSTLFVEGLNEPAERAYGHEAGATREAAMLGQQIEQMHRLRAQMAQQNQPNVEAIDRHIATLQQRLGPVGDPRKVAWREEDQGTYTRLGGDGALYTSLDDLQSLFDAVRDRRLPLSKAAYELWLEPTINPSPVDGFGDAQRGRRYAFGWMIDERLGERRYTHRGATKGFCQTIQWMPDSGRAVVVLMNSAPPGAAGQVATGPEGWDDALMQGLGERVLSAVLEGKPGEDDAQELAEPIDLRDSPGPAPVVTPLAAPRLLRPAPALGAPRPDAGG